MIDISKEWENPPENIKNGWYLHPIKRIIEKIELNTSKYNSIYKVNKNTGELWTSYGMYLSEPEILTYKINPIFISEEKLKKYYD